MSLLNERETPVSVASCDGMVATDLDVLFGRGDRTNNHPGNLYLHQAKHALQEAYLSAKRNAKNAIAQRLVHCIHDRGGRFLKRNATGGWEEATNQKALEKCAQAIRTMELTPTERSARRIYFTSKQALEEGRRSVHDLTPEEIAARTLFESVQQRIREEKKSKKRKNDNDINKSAVASCTTPFEKRRRVSASSTTTLETINAKPSLVERVTTATMVAALLNSQPHIGSLVLHSSMLNSLIFSSKETNPDSKEEEPSIADGSSSAARRRKFIDTSRLEVAHDGVVSNASRLENVDQAFLVPAGSRHFSSLSDIDFSNTN